MTTSAASRSTRTRSAPVGGARPAHRPARGSARAACRSGRRRLSDGQIRVVVGAVRRPTGRTVSLAVQEADIPCTSLLTSDHAETEWAKKLTDEDRRGPTALFWSNVNPYGTFRLDMDKRLDLAPLAVPR